MYLPESTNDFAFSIIYNTSDIIILILAIIIIIGLIIYTKKHWKQIVLNRRKLLNFIKFFYY